MDAKKVSVYEACDRAIKVMSRQNVEAFGRLKLANFDKINIIRTVSEVYRKSALQARKRYYDIACDLYILGLEMCGFDHRTATRMMKENITIEWVDNILRRTDPLTLYRFETETERKAYRLAETLEETSWKDREIDKALKYWTIQVNQYCINFTDYALIKAFQDAGVLEIEWVSERDNRVCHRCSAYDGQRFLATEVPTKPHLGCRCRFIPIFENKRF